MTASAIAGIALIHLLAAISPGPSFILSVRTAASEGFTAAAGLALGFGIGAALWAFAALAGLALVFEVLPPLFLALKVLGGLFLIWIAIKMWRHASEPMPNPTTRSAPRTWTSAGRLGITTMLANPKPAIFFGAVFVGLVPIEATLVERGLILANILWVETAWYLLVAYLFARPQTRAVYARMKTSADRLFGGILGLLGAKIALG